MALQPIGNGFSVDPLSGYTFDANGNQVSGNGPAVPIPGSGPADPSGASQATPPAPQQSQSFGSISGQPTAPGLMDWLRHPIQSAQDWAAANAGQNQAVNPLALQRTLDGQPPAPPPQSAPQPQTAPQAPPGAPPAPSQAPPAQPQPQPPQAPPGAPQSPQAGGPPGQPQSGNPWLNLKGPIAGGESGFGKTSPNTYGFTPSTFNAFIQSPANTGRWTQADIANPVAQEAAYGWNAQQNEQALTQGLGRQPTNPERLVAWHAGPGYAVAAAKNPQGDALRTYAALPGVTPAQAQAAFSNNPATLRPGMTNADVFSATAQFYASHAPNGPAVPGGPGGLPPNLAMAPMAATGPGPQGAAGATQTGFAGTDALARGMASNGGQDQAQIDPTTKAIADSAAAMAKIAQGYTPIDGTDKMIALASGLLQGPTLGAGLGKGLNNLLQVQQEQRQGAIQAGQAASTMALFAPKVALMQAQTGNKQAGTDLSEARAQNIPVQTGINQQRADAATTNANNATQRLGAQLNGQLYTAKEVADQNVKDNEAFDAQAQTARDHLALSQGALDTLSKTGVGPSLNAQLSRLITNTFGIQVGDLTPDQLQDMKKQLQQLNNASVLQQTGGKLPRANAEFNTLRSAALNLDTNNPDSIRALIQPGMMADQRVIDARNTWRRMSPQEQQQALGQNGLLANWRDNWSADEAATRGIGPSNAAGQAPTPNPQYQRGPSGAFQHVDPRTGLGFSINP